MQRSCQVPPWHKQSWPMVCQRADPSTTQLGLRFRQFGISVVDDAAAKCGWTQEARDLPAVFVRDVLHGLQNAVNHLVWDRAGAAFLASFDANTHEGRRGVARMLSVATGPSMAWVTAFPGAATTQLGNADFVIAGRHLLGLGLPTHVPLPPCLCGAGDASSMDHAMVCKLQAKMAALRHDHWASAWHHAIRRAGPPLDHH